MREAPRRTQHRGDGSRVVQKYIGNDPTLAGPGADLPQNWEDELVLVDGEIIGGWVRPLGGSINLSPHPSGEGVILEIAGVRHGIPLDVWADTLADFQKIHDETAELRTTKRAERAELEIAAKLFAEPIEGG